MKVALCYSGMFRTFLKNIDNHKETFLNKYDCDVYMHFWNVYGNGMFWREYFYDSTDLVSEEDIKYIEANIKPKKLVFEDFGIFEQDFEKNLHDEKIISQLKRISSMYYKIKKCGEILLESGINYDVVVRLRTDINFKDPIIIDEVENNSIYVCGDGVNFSDKTVCDIFSYGNQKTMHKYFKMYDSLPRLWKKSSLYEYSEFFMKMYLKEKKIKINKNKISFTLTR